jgi:deferrochelatase/peroxidase EfeB
MSPLNRRRFITGSLATLGASGGAAIAFGQTTSARAQGGTDDPSSQLTSLEQSLLEKVPFDGLHQSGIISSRPAQATYVALDSTAPNRATLFDTLQQINARARQLTQGTEVGVAEIDDPPPDSGILGAFDAPDSLTVNFAFGHTLFDDRYGISHLKPRQLIEMPGFAHDQIDPTRAGGDILIQIAAGQRDTVAHTYRELARLWAGQLTPRWILDGFTTAPRGPHPWNSTRNLFAFRDGTANPDNGNADLMNELIWVQPDRGEPDWAVDGTYVVVRTIRQHVEFWDRVGMLEQVQMIGRDRVTGAPLGGTHEFENPDYPSDPDGRRIPLDAHIRLANPRTPQTARQRLYRRSFNYDRGVDEAGDIDCGLIFTAYNQDPERQFATVQRRLEAEPMTDYITPVGGGYFFAPRGARGVSDWVGAALART